MPFRSHLKRQVTDVNPARLSHRARLVMGGVAVASLAFAIPTWAQTGDLPADASATTTASTEVSVDPSSTSTASPLPAADASTTAPSAPAPDPSTEFAAAVATMTPEQLVAFRLYIATPEERAALAALAPPPPPAPPAPAPAAAPEPAPAAVEGPAEAPHSPPGGFLACVRQRESGGNYAINTGNGYYGAYQFSQTTWNNTARHAGRGDLVGVRPSSASPADQDAMAQSLLAWQGRSPWRGPGC